MPAGELRDPRSPLPIPGHHKAGDKLLPCELCVGKREIAARESGMAIPQGVPVRAYGVTVFLCKREDRAWKLLLLCRVTAGRLGATWSQIWGVIEAGETAWEAALREIREESGVIPDRFYYADICEQCYDAHADCVCVIPVFAAFLDSEQAVVLNEEHSDYRWVTFEEAEALLPFASRRAVLHHIKGEFIDRGPNQSLRLPTF